MRRRKEADEAVANGQDPWGPTEFTWNDKGWTWSNRRARCSMPGGFDQVAADYERWRGEQKDAPNERL